MTLSVQPAIAIFDTARGEACGVAPVGVADPTFFAPITKVQREAGGVRGVAVNDAGQTVDAAGTVGGVPVGAVTDPATGVVETLGAGGVPIKIDGRLYPSGGDDAPRIIAMALANNGLVLLGAGVFNLTAAVRLSTPMRMRGVGKDQTIVICNNVTGAINLDSGSALTRLPNVYFADMTLDGQVTSFGFDEHCHLLSLSGVANLVIENVRFRGFRGDGVYLGSGSGGGERHNNDVTIRNCEFDGVNKDNRNGISIIDCDGADIHSNTFVNCTRANMPGAIDIEPNANAWHICKNITVRGNRFKNIGGNVGVVAFVFNQITLTEAPISFSVLSNSFDVTGSCCVTVVHSNLTRDLQVLIEANSAIRCRRFFNIGPVCRGITITSNAVRCSDASFLGFSANDKILDSNVSGNAFIAAADATSLLILIIGADMLHIKNNTFRNQVSTAIRIGYASGATITNTQIVGNLAITSRGGTPWYFCDCLGGWDSATSIYRDNGPSGNNLPI